MSNSRGLELKRREIRMQKRGEKVSKFRHLCPKLAASLGSAHVQSDEKGNVIRRLVGIEGAGHTTAPRCKYRLSLVK